MSLKSGYKWGYYDDHGRECRACGTYLSWEDFYKHPTGANGRQSVCKKCSRKKQDPDYYKKKTPEQKILDRARKRAREKGLDFDITAEDIVIPEICPVLKEPMDTPSLDRHDPPKGYVKGNIVVMSNRANTLKNNGTIEEFEKLLDYLRKLAVVT